MYRTAVHTALHMSFYLFLLSSHYFMRLAGILFHCKDEKTKVNKENDPVKATQKPRVE